MKVTKKILWRWIRIIIIVYCTIGIALYYLQDKFLFHPEKFTGKYSFAGKYEEVLIPINAQDSLSVVKFYPDSDVRKGVVVYYHGNMKNIAYYAGNASVFVSKGYEVWMSDYPGFGKSTGERNEKAMNQQARMVYTLAATRYKSDSIIIYGKSLGTGIASYVASYEPSKVLILETPYYSVTSLFRHYAPVYPVSLMSNYKIPSYEYISETKAPIVIFHGTGDDVIPYGNAKRLIPLLKTGDRFITIENGGHNNLTATPAYKIVIDSLLR